MRQSLRPCAVPPAPKKRTASPISILLNLILVPIISVVYSFSVILLTLGLIIPKLGGVLLFVAVILKLISQFVNGVVRDWMIISGWNFTKSLAFYYAGFIVASPMMNLKGKVKATIFCVLMTICAVVTLFSSLK